MLTSCFYKNIPGVCYTLKRRHRLDTTYVWLHQRASHSTFYTCYLEEEGECELEAQVKSILKGVMEMGGGEKEHISSLMYRVNHPRVTS